MSTVRNPRAKRDNCGHTAENEPSVYPGEAEQPLLATNTGVRLTCTMAAMISLFALFLCWAERESRVIRRFAVQSVALAGIHLCGVAVLAVISLLVGRIPYLGFLMSLMGWLIYIALAILALALRVRLMERAWHGRKYDLPMLERLIRRYY